MAGSLIAVLHKAYITPELAAPVERALAYALILIITDIFLAIGPLKPFVLKLFRSRHSPRSREGKRLAGQVAARAVGAVFLTMMFPRAISAILDLSLSSNPIHGTTPGSYSCMVLAAGYFMYDVFICITRYDENGVAFTLHAVVCCFAYVTALVTGNLHHIGAGFLMWEASTPFLYARWVLLKTGFADSKLMPVANYAFAVVFFFCRVVYGPMLSYEFFHATQKELKSPGPDAMAPATIYVYYFAMVVMNSLNYYWFANILRLALFGSKDVHKAEKVEHRE